MADRITPIEAIGEATKNTFDWPPVPVAHELPAKRGVNQQRELHAGAPADLVDLSIDARIMQRLSSSQHLRFLVDHDRPQVIVQIVDSVTDEVIRQIPMDELRRNAQQ